MSEHHIFAAVTLLIGFFFGFLCGGEAGGGK